jgi:hypothetical protein
MSWFYSFVLFKRDSGTTGPTYRQKFFTQYSVKSETEYDDRSFAFVASRLVLAERVMLFNTTEITHVVVYEYASGKLFDSRTVTHTLYPSPRLLSNHAEFSMLGARLGVGLGGLVGLQWRRNSKIGECFEGYFAGCVGVDDAHTLKIKGQEIRGVVLDMAGPLATRCWPFYANQLATMPQIQDEYSIDRFGAGKKFQPHTSGRKINHVSDMASLRRRKLSNLPQTFWLEQIMSLAESYQQDALVEYHDKMSGYDHRWGDGSLPPNTVGAIKFHRLASLWYPLMKFFGYNMSGLTEEYLAQHWELNSAIEVPMAGSGRWRGHGAQIHSCLNELYNCQQWLKYYFGLLNRWGISPFYYGAWRQQQWPNPKVLWQTVYDDWDNVTALFFRIVDCVNVLQMILLINEVKPPRGTRGALSGANFRQSKQANSTYPGAVPFVPMLEIYPIPREPFLFTPDPAPPVVENPPVEDIAWDGGAPDVAWDEGNESEWYAMQEAVRVALAKLEFVRRWVGRIRRQMPWYRSVPIEKIPPSQDEIINPIDDPTKEKLPWSDSS